MGPSSRADCYPSRLHLGHTSAVSRRPFAHICGARSSAARARGPLYLPISPHTSPYLPVSRPRHVAARGTLRARRRPLARPRPVARRPRRARALGAGDAAVDQVQGAWCRPCGRRPVRHRQLAGRPSGDRGGWGTGAGAVGVGESATFSLQVALGFGYRGGRGWFGLPWGRGVRHGKVAGCGTPPRAAWRVCAVCAAPSSAARVRLPSRRLRTAAASSCGAAWSSSTSARGRRRAPCATSGTSPPHVGDMSETRPQAPSAVWEFTARVTAIQLPAEVVAYFILVHGN